MRDSTPHLCPQLMPSIIELKKRRIIEVYGLYDKNLKIKIYSLSVFLFFVFVIISVQSIQIVCRRENRLRA